MNKPKFIKRENDGKILHVNTDGTYSFRGGHMRYSYNMLMHAPALRGQFTAFYPIEKEVDKPEYLTAYDKL